MIDDDVGACSTDVFEQKPATEVRATTRRKTKKTKQQQWMFVTYRRETILIAYSRAALTIYGPGDRQVEVEKPGRDAVQMAARMTWGPLLVGWGEDDSDAIEIRRLDVEGFCVWSVASMDLCSAAVTSREEAYAERARNAGWNLDVAAQVDAAENGGTP